MRFIKVTLAILCLLLFITIGEKVKASALVLEYNNSLNINNLFLNISGGLKNDFLYLDELSINIPFKKRNIIIGKHKISMGPGHFSQLMLSNNCPLSMIYYENDFIFFDLSLKGHVLVADIDSKINKKLFLHRVSFDSLFPGLHVALSESMMVHKMIHPAYYIPLPYWPYYLTAKLLGIYSEYNHYEDKYFGIDFTYNFDHEYKVYGELLVDEFPQISSANNPYKLASLIGFNYINSNDLIVRAEYSNVFNYVYVHRFPDNVYKHEDKPIGHWLGPDSDVFDIELERAFTSGNLYRIGFRHIRKGIGDFDKDYGSDHLEKMFMSEVTKREMLLRLGYEKDLYKSLRVILSLDVGKSYDYVNNMTTNIFNVLLKLKLYSS